MIYRIRTLCYEKMLVSPSKKSFNNLKTKKFLKTSLKIDTTKMKNFLLGMKDNAKNFYMTKLIPRYKVLQGKILYKTTGVKNTILEKIQKIKKSK